MSRRKQTITLREVAAEAGVSLGIASRVMGNYGSFSERSRVSVVAAAQKLSYSANGVARSLRLKRTRTIGVLISQISSYHWTLFVQGVEDAARKAGYGVVLCNTADDPKREMEYLKDMRERGTDGVIASPLAENKRAFRQIADSGYPIVAVNTVLGGGEVARILSDDRRAAADAMEYLGALGHRRIGLVAGAPELESGQQRLESYKVGLSALGLPIDDDLIAFGNYRQDDAYQATRQLITLADAPTALLVCNESMTGAALKCLRDHDIRIPDELSLVGFDDPDWASFYAPAITTLRAERFYMGRLACEALLGALDRDATAPQSLPEIVLRTQLVIRQSCAAPRTTPHLRDSGPDSRGDGRPAKEQYI